MPPDISWIFSNKFLDVVSLGSAIIMAFSGFIMGRIFFSNFAPTGSRLTKLWARFIAGLAFFSFMFFERLIESPTTAYRWFGGLTLWLIFIVFIYFGEGDD